MQIVSIDRLLNEVPRLKTATDDLPGALRTSGWDDNVNRSYVRYVDQMKVQTEEISSAKSIIEAAVNSLRGIEVDPAVESASALAASI